MGQSALRLTLNSVRQLKVALGERSDGVQMVSSKLQGLGSVSVVGHSMEFHTELWFLF